MLPPLALCSLFLAPCQLLVSEGHGGGGSGDYYIGKPEHVLREDVEGAALMVKPAAPVNTPRILQSENLKSSFLVLKSMIIISFNRLLLCDRFSSKYSRSLNIIIMLMRCRRNLILVYID